MEAGEGEAEDLVAGWRIAGAGKVALGTAPFLSERKSWLKEISFCD
jgi:hypothetical protein